METPKTDFSQRGSNYFLQTVNDTAPDVREASYDAIGVAMKVVSEKNIAPFLADVDNIKMQKVRQMNHEIFGTFGPR